MTDEEQTSNQVKNLSAKRMWIGIVTLFPECFEALRLGIPGRAQQKNLLEIQCMNPREHANNKHRTVDDRPYGGGPGMVMEVEPLVRSIDALKAQHPAAKVIYLSPQGRRLDQAGLNELAHQSELILLCGRYEGIDQRVIELRVDECWSIGDYVLSGGELAAMVMVDGITRLLPGALGDETSIEAESFMTGLLDYPHYTRPANYEGLEVPEVLQGGNHAHIERWRLKQALGQTWLHRPDLLERLPLSETQKKLLSEFILEYDEKRKV